ncbi:MAG: DUF4333 domain-containing protein [Nocardioides sp.]
MNLRTVVPAVALTAVGLLVAGCGNGAMPIDQDELQAAVTLSVQNAVGELPPEASCEGDLGADEGDTQTCSLTWRGQDYAVVATRGADGEAAFKVDPPLPAYPAPVIEANIASDYVSQHQKGAAPTRVDCPESMGGEVGEKQTCLVTLDDGSDLDAMVKLTSVDPETGYTTFNVTYPN